MKLINFMEKSVMERMETSGKDSLLKICADGQDMTEITGTLLVQQNNRVGYMTVLIDLGNELNRIGGAEV